MGHKTLEAGEILTSRANIAPSAPLARIGRRSAVAAVAYGGLALVGLSTQACGRSSGCTDSDTGAGRDAAGNGRHCGCTDHDTSDAAGHGIHCGTTGCTDTDPTDAVGNGHHCI